VTERLPHWLRGVLSLEAAYRWRALAGEGCDLVVSGSTALAVQLRHRVCDELVCVPAGGLLRETITLAGMPIASADDVLVHLLCTVEEPGAELLSDLRQLELRTPLQVEEGLVLLARVRPEVSTEQVISDLSAVASQSDGVVGEYWSARLPEVAASMAVRGFVRRVVVPRQRGPVHKPALTLGSSGQVWVEPHERDGQPVAGYWRRR